MRQILFILIGCTFAIGYSQQAVIDSLKQVISSKPPDSVKIKAYSDLCWYYRGISMDSAFSYGQKALDLSKKTKNKTGEAQALNDIGILHFNTSEYSRALVVYHSALKLRKILEDSMGMASLFNKIGLVHQNTYQLDSALIYGLKALAIYEGKGITRNAYILKNNIANIYKNLKQYDKALETHLEIADYNRTINNDLGLVRSYNNIANAYIFLKDTANAQSYYKRGIEIAENKGYLTELAALYNNNAGISMNRKDYSSAIIDYENSLKIRRQLKDDFGLGSTLLNLGVLYIETKQFSKVEGYLRESMKLSQASNANEQLLNTYDKLSLYFSYRNMPDSTAYYSALYKAMNDSIFSARITKEVAEVQEKYNSAKREKELVLQRAEIAEKELDISKKNLYLLGLGGLVVIVTLLGVLFINRQKLKTQQIQKESELKEALVRIETQNKLQDQRLRISRDLHDNIGAQLTFIISTLDNLKYGFKLPEKLNSKLQGVSEFTTSTIYELRDTIWAMNKSQISFEDLQVRISNFIDKADLAALGIRFSFKVKDNVDGEITFSSVRGMNIYRIIQESINNALKYAEAKNISVEISQTNERLSIKIIDDGVGFNRDKVELGNGLNNMKKRADEIGGQLSIDSHINRGTEITLVC